MVSEANKKLRSLYGTWKVMEQLQRDYPSSTIILMATDSPTPFDILVVDPEKGKLVAVEVKATTPSSAASRRLSDSQKDFGRLLESRPSWKAEMKRYVLYGEPGPSCSAKEVSWKGASDAMPRGTMKNPVD